MASTTTSTTSIPTTFKAYEYAAYGPPTEVLKINAAATHATLQPAHVRVKVHSAALNPVDAKLVEEHGLRMTGSSPTPDKRYRIGFDGAGTVVEVGIGATHTVGEEVYFMTSFSSFGTFAEYIDVDETFVARKPTNLSFDEAASVPLVALTSHQALVQHAQLQRGERVLVLGGSSATGIFAIQLAKALGAAHVTATTSSRNAAFVQSLGADEVIDYTQHKWADVIAAHSLHVVYDCGVEPTSWNTGDAQRVLVRDDSGRFVTLLPFGPSAPSTFGAKCIGTILASPSAEHLDVITRHIEAGEVKPVIDSVYPFTDLLAAIAKQDTQRAVGKLVLQVV